MIVMSKAETKTLALSDIMMTAIRDVFKAFPVLSVSISVSACGTGSGADDLSLGAGRVDWEIASSDSCCCSLS